MCVNDESSLNGVGSIVQDVVVSGKTLGFKVSCQT